MQEFAGREITLTHRIDKAEAEIQRLRRLCLERGVNPEQWPEGIDQRQGMYDKYQTFRTKDGKVADTVVWHTDRRDPQGLSDLLHRAEQQWCSGSNPELARDLVEEIAVWAKLPDVKWVKGQFPEPSDIQTALDFVRDLMDDKEVL